MDSVEDRVSSGVSRNSKQVESRESGNKPAARLRSSEIAWLIRLADPASEPPGADIRDDALPAILDAANYNRVLPTVIERLPSDLLPIVPQRIRDQLALDAAQMLVLRHMGAQVLAALAKAEIRAVIVKGEHFATKLYSPPAWRPYTDIDLMMPKCQIDDARAVMKSIGFVRCSAMVKHDTGYAEDKWLIYQAGIQVLVELHWDLINSPSLRRGRRLSHSDIVSRHDHIDAVGDLLVACVHGALGHTFERLYHIVDIAQAARGEAGLIDPEMLAERARSCGLCDVVGLALSIAGRVLGDRACLALPGRASLRPIPEWAIALLDAKNLMTRRGSFDRRSSWRRPLLREWLKQSPVRARYS